MRTLISLFSFILLQNCLWSQVFFQSTVSTEGSISAVSVDILSNNTYIVAGNYTGAGETQADYVVSNINPSGAIIWSRTIGGSGNELAVQVLAANDGGFLVLGTTNGYGASQADIFVVKADSDGTVEWSKIIGGPLADAGRSVIQTADGGYLICGSLNISGLNYHQITMKLNAQGGVVWQNVTGAYNIIGGDAVELANGGFVLVGGVKNGQYYRMYLSKISGNGDLIWEKSFFGNLNGGSYEIMPTDDGGFICFGETKNIIGAGDVWVAKYNSSGDLLSSTVYGIPSKLLRTFAASEVPGGYAISVYDYTAESTSAGLLIIDMDGSVQSFTSYSGSDLSTQSEGLVCDEDGCFLVGKQVQDGENQMLLLKTNFQGQIGQQCPVIQNEIETAEWPTQVTEVTSDQYNSLSIAAVGAFSEGLTLSQAIDCKFTVGIDENALKDNEAISAKIIQSSAGNPNRLLIGTEFATEVSIGIFNASGQLIVNKNAQKLNSGDNWIDLPDLSSGMYAIQIWNGNSSISVKLIAE